MQIYRTIVNSYEGLEKDMITLTGKSVFGGVEIGKIAFYKRNERQVKMVQVEDAEAEVKRFEDAKQVAISQLQGLYKKQYKTLVKKMP